MKRTASGRPWLVVAGILQQLPVQIVVQSRWTTPYSLADNFISDLGNSVCGPLWLPPYAYVCSPWWWLMSVSFVVYGLAWIGAGLLFHGPDRRWTRRATVAAGGFACLIAIPENTVTFLHFTGVFAYCGLVVAAAALAGRQWLRARRRAWAGWSFAVVAASLLLYVPAGVTGAWGRLFLGWGLGFWQRVALLPAVGWVLSVGCVAGVGGRPGGGVLTWGPVTPDAALDPAGVSQPSP